MLILSRKQGEQIVINENIVVTVMHISPSTVRIGVSAPRDVSIRRNELSPKMRPFEVPVEEALGAVVEESAALNVDAPQPRSLAKLPLAPTAGSRRDAAINPRRLSFRTDS